MWRLVSENNSIIKDFGDKPILTEGQVLIRLFYVVLYPNKSELPQSDSFSWSFLGIIDQNKGHSHRFVKGDWVLGYLENSPLLAEYIAVSEISIFKVPEKYSFQEAASLAYPTFKAFRLFQEINLMDSLIFGTEISPIQSFLLQLMRHHKRNVVQLKHDENAPLQLEKLASLNNYFHYAVTSSSSEFEKIKRFFLSINLLEASSPSQSWWTRFFRFLFISKKSEIQDQKQEQLDIQRLLDDSFLEPPELGYISGIDSITSVLKNNDSSTPILIVLMNP